MNNRTTLAIALAASLAAAPALAAQQATRTDTQSDASSQSTTRQQSITTQPERRYDDRLTPPPQDATPGPYQRLGTADPARKVDAGQKAGTGMSGHTQDARKHAADRPMAGHPNPYAQPNNSWITLSGTVKSGTADQFQLDYGTGQVTVEMDSPSGNSGYVVVPGDRVSVTGKIDDDLFETTSIEAASVYVEGLNTRFYAPSAMDEEDATRITTATAVVIPATTVVVGTVSQVNGSEFTLDTGNREITVDTSQLRNDPLDDKGPRITAGKRVSVTGNVDADFFRNKELEARSVTMLTSL